MKLYMDLPILSIYLHTISVYLSINIKYIFIYLSTISIYLSIYPTLSISSFGMKLCMGPSFLQFSLSTNVEYCTSYLLIVILQIISLIVNLKFEIDSDSLKKLHFFSFIQINPSLPFYNSLEDFKKKVGRFREKKS